MEEKIEKFLIEVINNCDGKELYSNDETPKKKINDNIRILICAILS